jgi:hypothetical protein
MFISLSKNNIPVQVAKIYLCDHVYPVNGSKCVSVNDLALCAYSLLLVCRLFLGMCGHMFMMVV